jgi:hypothetical protein
MGVTINPYNGIYEVQQSSVSANDALPRIGYVFI